MHNKISCHHPKKVRPAKQEISQFKAFAFPLPKQRFGTPKQKIGFSQPGPNRCFGGGEANALNKEIPCLLGRTGKELNYFGEP